MPAARKRGRKPSKEFKGKLNEQEQLKNIAHYIEWKNNPVKFIEECVELPEAGGNIGFKLYEPQKRVLKSFFDNHHLVLLKSRQTGFSTLLQAISVYVMLFHKNTIIGIASRSGTEASDFSRKATAMMDRVADNFPWLFPGYKACTAQSMILKNGSQLWSAAVSPSNPGGLFRGKSISFLILDEVAHINKIDEAWTGVAPATSKAQAAAAKKGIPFGTVLISTPNKTNGTGKFYFQAWSDAVKGDNLFTPEQIHWSEIEEFANDPEWYIKQCKILQNNPKKIAQELELKFVGDESSLFSEETQEALQECGEDPIRKIDAGPHANGATINLFEELDRRKFYLIGVDSASAAGTDYSTIEVMHVGTMNQVAEFRGKLEPKKFAEVVKKVANLMPNHLIVVENSGGYGLTVLNELQFDDTGGYNLFGEQRVSKATKRRSSSNQFVYGLSTNAKTRPLILDALYTYATDFTECIKSKELALELLALTSKKNKIEADVGFNDDLCMAMGFILYVREYAKESLSGFNDAETYDEIDDITINTLDIIGYNTEDTAGSIDGNSMFGNLNFHSQLSNQLLRGTSIERVHRKLRLKEIQYKRELEERREANAD